MEKKYYKAFNNDMTCRDVKYQVGKTYKEDYAKLCESGFHFCENPLDCLHYYPLIDDTGNIVKINRVTPLGEIDDKLNPFSIPDTKKCTTKIKIGELVDLDTFIKESREYMSNNTIEFIKNQNNNSHDRKKQCIQEAELYNICGTNKTNAIQNLTSSRPNGLYLFLTGVKSNILLYNYYDLFLENTAYSNNLVFDKVDESNINSTGGYCNIICRGNSNLISNNSYYTNIVIEGTQNVATIKGTNNRIKLLSDSDASLINVKKGQANKIYNESNNVNIRIHDAYNTIISNGNNCNILVNIPWNLIECKGKNCNIIVNGECNYIKASIGTHITFTDSINSFKKHIVIDNDKYSEFFWYGIEQYHGICIINEVINPSRVEKRIAKMTNGKSN